MFHQTGQPSLIEPDTGCLGLLPLGSEACTARRDGTGLPSFVSSEPPRSEGEALLRRIFSRAGQRV
jgi:hypothetical protein